MRDVLLVARQELRTQLRRRTFYVATFGMPVIIAAIVLAIGLLGRWGGLDSLQRVAGNTRVKPAGLVDRSGIIAMLPPAYAASFQRFPSEAAADEALSGTHIDVYFVVHADYRTTGQVDRVSRQATFLNARGADVRDLTAVIEANLVGDPLLAQRINDPATFETTITTVGAGTPGGGAPAARRAQPALTTGISTGFSYLLAFSLLSGGGLLLSSLTDERSSRTIELLLTSLRPWQLLTGKLGGLGLVGLLQLAIWIVIGQTLLRTAQGVATAAAFATSATAAIAPSLWGWIVVLFLLGYLLYGSAMAILAAVGTSGRESNQISALLTLPVLLPVVFVSVLSDRPNGVTALVLSFFPLTAPTTVLLRLGLGPVPAWQLAISIGILLLSIAAALATAGRLFRATTLLTGARPTLGAMLRAIRSP